MYLGQLWLRKVDEQIAFIKEDEYDSFLNGTLEIPITDPRFDAINQLHAMIYVLERELIKSPEGLA